MASLVSPRSSMCLDVPLCASSWSQSPEQGPDSQIITAADDPVLARNEAAGSHRNVCQLKGLDGGLCLVAPYVDVAAVEGGEDPWLFTRTCQLGLVLPRVS